MSRPICGPFGRKCPDRSLVRRKSLSAKDYGRTHFELLRRDRTCETGFESGRCLSRPALVSRPNPTLGRRGWVNYLWVSFLLKASVPTHRIDRDHPATADSPRGNRPSPAASTSTGGDLFSPLVKTDPHHRRGSFFRSRRGSTPQRTNADRDPAGWGPSPYAGLQMRAIDSYARRVRRGKDPISIQPQKLDSSKISFVDSRRMAVTTYSEPGVRQSTRFVSTPSEWNGRGETLGWRNFSSN